MTLDAYSSKLTGIPDASGWSQIHEFRPQEEDKLSTRGVLFAVITISNSGSGVIDSVALGREILTRIHEEYYGPKEKTAFSALKDAILRVSQEFADEGTKVEIAAASLVDGIMYVAVGGGAQAYVLRSGMLAKILESEAGVVAASGYPEKDDVFLLGTKQFFSKVTQGVLKACLESPTPEIASEKLTSMINKEGSSGEVGAIILKFFEKGESFLAPVGGDSPTQTYPMRPQSGKRFVLGIVDKLLSLLPEKKIVVGQGLEEIEGNKKKKLAITVGIALIALLCVSIFFGLRQRTTSLLRGRYESTLTGARHDFEEAKSLSELNPSRARELMFSAKDAAFSLKDQGIKDKELDALISEINSSFGKITGVYEVEPELFLDLALVSSGLEGDDVSFSDGRMLILDRDGQKIVSITLTTKKTNVLGGPDKISGAKGVAAYVDRSFYLADDGVFEIDDESSRVIEKEWDGDALVHAFAGNIYILDKSGSVIWRYPGGGGTFGSRSNWFGAGVEPNLGNVSTWAIDGAIWILDGGDLVKYSLGKQDVFDLKGGGAGFVDVYTDEVLENIYLLDSSAGKVSVYDKKGEFKGEYVGEKIKESSKVLASEKDGKIILLAGSKLYSIKIGGDGGN